VLGGATTALYGLIGVIGIRIWVENRVDFSKPKNQLTAGIALIIGIADFTFAFGQASFGGIILGTIAAIVVYHLMDLIGRARGTDEAPTEVPDAAHAATAAVAAEPRAD
jgi:NCS2 family nucleobase:cation symporter-2